MGERYGFSSGQRGPFAHPVRVPQLQGRPSLFGEQINFARLQAYPTANRWLDCQCEYEKLYAKESPSL